MNTSISSKILMLLTLFSLSSCMRDKKIFTISFQNDETITVKEGFRFNKCYTEVTNSKGEIILKGNYHIDDYYRSSNTMACRDVHNGHYALLDTKGLEIIPYSREYGCIIQIINPTGEYYLFSKRKKVGICDSDGIELIPAKYEFIGTCNDNYREPISLSKMLICRNTDCDMFNLLTRQFVATYDKVERLRTTNLKKELENKYIGVVADDKYGVFDLQSAQNIIEPKYSSVELTQVSDDAIYFEVKNFDNKVGAFDYKGRMILPIKYDFVGYADVDEYIEGNDFDNDYSRKVRVPSYKANYSVGGSGYYSSSEYIPSNNTFLYETPNYEESNSENIARLERMYRNQYSSWELHIIDNINSLSLAKDSGFGYAAISQIQYNIKDEQNEMRKIRQEAANYGIIIEMSEYENKPL